jgi:hypothetical protein
VLRNSLRNKNIIALIVQYLLFDRKRRETGCWFRRKAGGFISGFDNTYVLLDGIQVVLLRFNQVVLPPDRKPFAVLVLQDHLVFVLLQFLSLRMYFETREHLPQQILA